MLLMFGLMFVVLYLLVLRPQQRREKERQAMLKDLKKNDRVLTSGGLYGVVMNLSDEVVTLKVDENHNVRMRFARSAIASVVGEGENGAAVDDGKKEA
ncbi:MAG: preprotein translocase subunit YajC [Planctomycetes bacterium]|nr:preprotein translocase subunit YajC [Planctomycetota bacterium]